jgi:hypothetical protein
MDHRRKGFKFEMSIFLLWFSSSPINWMKFFLFIKK